jgi:hypothetical protein
MAMDDSALLPADTIRALTRREFPRKSEAPTPVDPAIRANLQGIVSMAMSRVGAQAVKGAAGKQAPKMVFELSLTPKSLAALNDGTARFMPSSKGGHYTDVLGANSRVAEKGVLRRVDPKAGAAGLKGALPSLAFNAVSLAVGQAHMAAITRRLDGISDAVAGIRRQMDLLRDGWLVSTVRQLQTHLDLAMKGSLSLRDQWAVIDDLRAIEKCVAVHEHVFDQMRSDAMEALRAFEFPVFTLARHCDAFRRAWEDVLNWDQLRDALLGIRVLSLQTTLALDVFDPYSASRSAAMVQQFEAVRPDASAFVILWLPLYPTPPFCVDVDFGVFRSSFTAVAQRQLMARRADEATVAQLLDALLAGLAQRESAEKNPIRVLVAVDAKGEVGHVWWSPEGETDREPAAADARAVG